MDGTLCTFRPTNPPNFLITANPFVFAGEPQNYMFGQMRSALAIPKSVDILDHIHALPSEQEQKEAFAKIEAIESEAMAKQVPQPGLVQLMEFLDRCGVRRAICTRNFE